MIFFCFVLSTHLFIHTCMPLSMYTYRSGEFHSSGIVSPPLSVRFWLIWSIVFQHPPQLFLYAFSIVTSVLALCLCSTRAVPSTLNARCLVFQLPKGMVCLRTVYGIWLYASGSNTLVAEWLQSSHPTYFIQASTSTHVQGRPLSITSAFRIFTHSCRFRP